MSVGPSSEQSEATEVRSRGRGREGTRFPRDKHSLGGLTSAQESLTSQRGMAFLLRRLAREEHGLRTGSVGLRLRPTIEGPGSHQDPMRSHPSAPPLTCFTVQEAPLGPSSRQSKATEEKPRGETADGLCRTTHTGRGVGGEE